MTWLKKFISRKFLLAILTPVLVTMFNAVNAFLPEGTKLSPDQVSSAIEWIVGVIVTAIVSQGVVDTVAETKKPTQVSGGSTLENF